MCALTLKITKLSMTIVARISVNLTCFDVNAYFVLNYLNHLHIFNRITLCDSIDLIKQLFCSVTSASHLVIWSLHYSKCLFVHKGVAIIVHIITSSLQPTCMTNFFRLK